MKTLINICSILTFGTLGLGTLCNAESGFDSLQPGALAGQSIASGNWDGDGEDFELVEGPESRRLVVSRARDSRLGSVLFTPEDAEGISADALTVQLQLEMLEPPVEGEPGTQTVFAIQIGYAGDDASTGARIYLRADGRIGYNKGDRPGILVPNVELLGPGDIADILVQLDYPSQTYRLQVNDFTIGDPGEGIRFRGPSTSRAVRLANIGSEQHRPVAIHKFLIQ